jgi:hypothetical protein
MWDQVTEEFFSRGKPHRDNGPAYIHFNLPKVALRDALLRRPAAASVVEERYYRDGVLHRDEGPAVVRAGSSEEFWRDGVRIR